MDSKKVFEELYKKVEVLPNKYVVDTVAHYDEDNEEITNVKLIAKYDKYQFAQLIENISNDEHRLDKYARKILSLNSKELNKLYSLFLKKVYNAIKEERMYDEYDENRAMKDAFQSFMIAAQEEGNSNG